MILIGSASLESQIVFRKLIYMGVKLVRALGRFQGPYQNNAFLQFALLISGTMCIGIVSLQYRIAFKNRTSMGVSSVKVKVHSSETNRNHAFHQSAQV